MQLLKLIYYTIAFILELGMVAAFFIWGYHQGSSTLSKYSYALVLVALVVTFWGIFQAPRSAHRLGFSLRIATEIILFSIAALMLYKTGNKTWAIIFGIATLFKEILSFVFKDE